MAETEAVGSKLRLGAGSDTTALSIGPPASSWAAGVPLFPDEQAASARTDATATPAIHPLPILLFMCASDRFGGTCHTTVDRTAHGLCFSRGRLGRRFPC
ncbi:hypothetical protein [Naasia aerilata]|uniref:hypothetical protein n=1 Tax=Naasia aerilata TaxID=1162966 RepID=UPI00257430B7|nr:hypothetical protein [Naasia aerilata]